MKKFFTRYRFWWIFLIVFTFVYFNRNDLVFIISVIGSIAIYLLWANSQSIEGKQTSSSHWFNVDVKEAVVSHHKFTEITGLEKYKNWDEYDKLPKHTKEKWDAIWKELDKAYVGLTFLASENAYYVNNWTDSPSIIFRKSRNNLIYSSILVGEKSGLTKNIEFLLYERQVKGKWFIVPCLQYNDPKKMFSDDDRHKFEILFEFPMFEDLSEEKIKELGFEIDKMGGGDVYQDHFGEYQGVPTEIKYKKNGAYMRFVS